MHEKAFALWAAKVVAVFVAATTSGSIEGVDSVLLDFADKPSLEAAMQGVSTLYMVLVKQPDMITWGKNVIDSARKCGVKHIVRSGGSLADGNSAISVRKFLAETDQYLNFKTDFASPARTRDIQFLTTQIEKAGMEIPHVFIDQAT